MNRQDLIDIGFKEIPHFTVTNALDYNLGRGRRLSLGCIGTPNEMLWICQQDYDNPKETTDLVCLHNWDYDGYLTLDKIKKLINILEDIKNGNKSQNNR